MLNYIHENSSDADRLAQFASSAFVFGPHSSVKAAALLFKYVMPFCFSYDRGGELLPPLFKSFNRYWEIQDEILDAISRCGHSSLVTTDHKRGGVDETGHIFNFVYAPVEGSEETIDEVLIELLAKDAHYIEQIVDYDKIPRQLAKNQTWSKVRKAATRKVSHSFRELILSVAFSETQAPLFGCDLLGSTDTTTNSVLITLTNIPWINLSSTPWEQIIEFRKDATSQSAFRCFRAFLAQTYSGKSANFIQDDFLRRIDDFERARIKHGFSLQTSTIRSIINSKYIMGGGLSGLLTWIFGGSTETTILGSAALLAGVGVEVANIGLDIRAANFEAAQRLDSAELGYIIRARDSLQTKVV